MQARPQSDFQSWQFVVRCWLLVLPLLVWSCGGKAETTVMGVGGVEGTGGSRAEEEAADEALDAPGTVVEGCVEGAMGASAVRGLNPSVSFDAVSLVALDEEHYVDLVIEQFGEPCDVGAVGSECVLALQERQVGYYSAGSETARALIVSEDEVSWSLGYFELREFLGEIDTPNEAAVLAWSEGWQIACTEILMTEGAWVLVPRDASCTDGRGWIEVTRDGTVSHSAHCAIGGS